MTLLYDQNEIKTGLDNWAGRYLFLFKELAVSAGWVVKGSSDGGSRTAYDGVTAALPGAQQGTGDFDAWQTGTGTRHGTKADGDPRVDSWLVLENDGRELLIAPTWSSSASADGNIRMIYAPKGSGGFDGSVAAAGTLPGAATNEQLIFGTRGAITGVPVLLANEQGYIHMWADDTAESGAFALGFCSVDSSIAGEGHFVLAPITTATASSADEDPVVILANQGAPNIVGNQGWAWNYASDVIETVSLDENQSFWGGDGTVDPAGSDPYRGIDLIMGSGGNEIVKGELSLSAIAWAGPNRVFPNLLNDTVNSRVYCYYPTNGGFLFPWVDVATTPLP